MNSKFRRILTISIISILVLPSCFAGQAQYERFDKWLRDFDQALGPKQESSKQAAKSLLTGNLRVSAFNLQALGKIYESQDEEFQNIRKNFKQLEDGIGEAKKWSDLLAEGKVREVSKERLQKLESNYKKAVKELEEMLEDSGWIGSSKLSEMKSFLAAFDFGSYKQDKQFVVGQLIEDLDKLQETEFSMKVLEEGDGVHELRRELRWISIKKQVVNGLIAFKKDTQQCPISEYQSLVDSPLASSKYAILSSSAGERYPCRISQCLYLALVEKINQFGDMKDKIEADLNLVGENDDKTPKKFLPELNRLYRELKSSEVLPSLSSELSQCL
jgi:hypothetical protein